MMFPQMAESHNKKTTPLPDLDDAGYALVIRLPLGYSLYSSITPEKFRSIAIVLDPRARTGRAFPGITWESERNVARKRRAKTRRRYGTLARQMGIGDRRECRDSATWGNIIGPCLAVKILSASSQDCC